VVGGGHGLVIMIWVREVDIWLWLWQISIQPNNTDHGLKHLFIREEKDWKRCCQLSSKDSVSFRTGI